MKDKIQKIRKEVKKLHGNPYYMMAVKDVLEILDMQEEPAPKIFEDMLNAKTPAESLGISAEEHEKIIDLCLYGKEPEMVDIDDLPKEEPVSEDLMEATNNYCLNVRKSYPRVKDETDRYICNAFMAGAKWQKEKDSIVSEDLEKIVEEIAEPTILNAYGTKELARRLRNTICGTSVSEGLEEASKEWLSPQLDKSYAKYGEVKMMELTHFDGYAMLDAIEFGVQWQKAKDESTTEDLGEYINELSKQFPEVSFAKLSRIAVRVSRWQRNQDTKNKLPKVINRTDLDEYAYQCAYDMSNDWMIENPTWHNVEDACKLGANWHKKQMMKDAVNGLVYAQRTNGEVMFRSNYVKKEGFEFGDKVKVIVIKED